MGQSSLGVLPMRRWADIATNSISHRIAIYGFVLAKSGGLRTFQSFYTPIEYQRVPSVLDIVHCSTHWASWAIVAAKHDGLALRKTRRWLKPRCCGPR